MKARPTRVRTVGSAQGGRADWVRGDGSGHKAEFPPGFTGAQAKEAIDRRRNRSRKQAQN